VRNTARYPITKNYLCFVCYSEPNKCQEDFNWVTVALIILFCIRINMQVSKVRYGYIYTQRLLGLTPGREFFYGGLASTVSCACFYTCPF